MITARGLSKRYGNKLALDDVSFDIEPGLVTGFLGPNGAGKSTSMRLMVGLDRPTSGEVTIAGKPFVQHGAPSPSRVCCSTRRVFTPVVPRAATCVLWPPLTASARNASTRYSR